jgi:adenylate kinase
MYVIFLGAPGAGKGTQAAVVADEIKLVHVASGDLFRQALQQGTPLGKQAESYMKQGKLVPDDITIQMVLERLSAPDTSGGVIFDGFPRTLEQGKALDQAMEGQGKKIDVVVYIKVAEAELLKRLSGRWICRNCQTPYHLVSSPPRVKGKCDKCGGELYQRPDDTEATVKERLKVYFAQTTPLIDYYKKMNKLVEVNGEGEVASIGKRIVQALKKQGG